MRRPPVTATVATRKPAQTTLPVAFCCPEVLVRAPRSSGRAVADHANQQLEVDRLGHERRAGVPGLLDRAVVRIGADDHRANAHARLLELPEEGGTRDA